MEVLAILGQGLIEELKDLCVADMVVKPGQVPRKHTVSDAVDAVASGTAASTESKRRVNESAGRAELAGRVIGGIA